MNEKKEALNEGSEDKSDSEEKHTLEKGLGKESPEGTGQSSKDQDGEGEGSSDSEGNEEETVTIPKSEYEQIQEDRDNYKEGLLSFKKRFGRDLPGSDESSDDDESSSDDGEEKKEVDTSKFITNEELASRNEDAALTIVDRDSNMPHLNEYWDEIVANFDPETSRDKVSSIVNGVQSAYNEWAKKNPDKADKSSKNEKKEKTESSRKAKSEASAESPTGGGSEKSTDQRSTKNKKDGRSILPKKKSMDDWYSEE